MSVQNNIFIGEVFQIELSDGLGHSFGPEREYTSIQLVSLRGGQVLRSLYECAKHRIRHSIAILLII